MRSAFWLLLLLRRTRVVGVTEGPYRAQATDPTEAPHGHTVGRRSPVGRAGETRGSGPMAGRVKKLSGSPLAGVVGCEGSKSLGIAYTGLLILGWLAGWLLPARCSARCMRTRDAILLPSTGTLWEAGFAHTVKLRGRKMRCVIGGLAHAWRSVPDLRSARGGGGVL